MSCVCISLINKDRKMLLALVLFTLLTYADAIGNLAQCPSACSCNQTSSDTQLYIKCIQVHPDVDEEQLSHQLDSMLSADHFVEHLTSLSITYTPMTRVPASVCKLLNLTSLNLNYNKLTELPDNCFTKLTKLVTLKAEHNAITRLQDGLFDGLQSLVELYLDTNRISFIGLRLFSNSSDLTSLRYINLDDNRLTSLEPWWYYRCVLRPSIIKLSFNLISNFTNELNFRFRCGMKRPYGRLRLYENRIIHIMDIYKGWNIAGRSVLTTTLCLANMHRHSPQMKLFYGGGTYACDCTDFPFYTVVNALPSTRVLQDVRCEYLNLNDGLGANMLASTVPLIEFVCEQPGGCPSRCQCVYRPANATLHVYCSAGNLSSLPLDLPPLPKSYVKYKLDFSNNKLFRRLEYRPYFVNTSVLDVSDCSLSEVTVADLKDVSRFSLVNVRGNMLESLPRQADTVNISARLLIGNNPWRCSCDNSWMIGWIQSLSHQISDPGDIVCRSPSRMYGRNVLESTVEDFCVDPVKHALTITLSAVSSVAAAILFLVITGRTIYRFRVKFYSRWKFHPFDRDECVGEDMDYDVFLCCSSLDHDPHGRRIRREIESNGYRVCYHEEDFLPGQLILDNMAQSVERSKRTLCLITNNFLQSSFCMTEFHYAYHHNVAEKRKKRLIVLMMLDNLTDLHGNDHSDTEVLRQYLRQYTYIHYPADDWLDKLLYALPVRGLLQHNEDPNDDVLLQPREDRNDDDVPLLENVQ